MILFLDFDGVLHPSPTDYRGPFCHLDVLQDWLRAHPRVDVVISSSWRETYPFEDVLRELFSADLQSRVIGVTPVLPASDLEECPRWTEIHQWLLRNDYHGIWIAVDDAVGEFPKACPQLVACQASVGIDTSVLAQLSARYDQTYPGTALPQ